jgi:hypothetical protein
MKRERGADWLAWLLQFIFGLIVGAALGFREIGRIPHANSLNAHQVSQCIWGAALIGGALLSFVGDEIWGERPYRVIPPEEMKQSGMSRLLSIAAALAGAALVVNGLEIWH